MNATIEPSGDRTGSLIHAIFVMSSGANDLTAVVPVSDSVMTGILPLGVHLTRQCVAPIQLGNFRDCDQPERSVVNLPSQVARHLGGPTNGTRVTPRPSLTCPVRSPWPTGCVGPRGTPCLAETHTRLTRPGCNVPPHGIRWRVLSCRGGRSAIRTEIPKAASHTGAGPSSGSLIAIE